MTRSAAELFENYLSVLIIRGRRQSIYLPKKLHVDLMNFLRFQVLEFIKRKETQNVFIRAFCSEICSSAGYHDACVYTQTTANLMLQTHSFTHDLLRGD